MSAAGLLLAAALAAPGRVIVLAPAGPDRGAPGWIGAVVEETLPRALQRVGIPALPAGDPRRALAEIGLGGSTPTRATAVRAAEALGARTIVFGSWDLAEGGLVLALRPFDTSTAALAAPSVARGPVEKLGRLVDQLARELAGRGEPASAAGPPAAAVRALGEGLAQRDPQASIEGLRRALALHPGYPEAGLALARLLHEAGRFAEARAVLAGLRLEPVFERERQFLDGACLLGLGRHSEADVVYARLAAADPTASVLANRAAARLRLPDGPSGASALLRQALDRAPFAADLPFDLGWARLVEGDARGAAFWLRDAVHYAPDDARARLALAWALGGSGRAEEADEQWHAAAAVDPSLASQRRPAPTQRLERVLASETGLLLDPARAEDARLAREHAARGEALLASGQVEAGVAELEQAARLEPTAAGPHRLLGRAYRTRGDERRGLAELRLSLLCREDPSLRREIAERLRAEGREAEARELLRER